jgi:hypothetical protein
MSLAIEILTIMSKLYATQNFDSSFIRYFTFIRESINKAGYKFDPSDAYAVRELLDVLPDKYSEMKNELSRIDIYKD